MDYTLAGISLVPVIVGLVSFLKSLGVSGKSLTVSSFIVASAIFALYKAAELFPDARVWIEAVFFVLAAPVASGLYDFIRRDLLGK